MGTYIHFTDEQKERANSVDLEEFLRQRGEKLLRAGRESRLARVHHITVRGNEWYDHIARQGGLLYVFEAPMDLLSFLTLYPDRWQEHSYVALCGTGGQAVCWMLEQHPSLQSVVLCLDHDEPGQTAARRLQEELQGAGYHSGILLPVHKDWNDGLVQGQTMADLAMTMGQSM
ncbi:toprim domain-containing protein [Flavonifractor plautii]|uniref:DNA primase (Bacterial type) n=1 Tax=Flavonifractor plautii TaxID=292800 RepID=A0A173YQV0_FLAPL|nr:toprim domain-containing protein [Flavonifractor plautii]ERI68698.1 hypothetical protein HMPREF0239_03639 [Clostridium sp. ATCC BAA-442]MCB5853834.1 toprim domain-containing protein [Flavonifractor plautii]MDB7881730.1 toprim domain-containing protein [Flavonifractor plautii]MDB7903981.1 toprim domain-containing protein [Flavonifractor plautii]MDB7921718.1 toprim domain-containing protein [Flavonifractor plautii]